MTGPLVTATIGLGGNLGCPATTLTQALEVLRDRPDITALKASRFYRTVPVQATGPDFCNAVAQVITSLSALQLLEVLLTVERQFGRQRLGWHAPRTLDLDLIAMASTRVVSSQLTVPHPRAHERAFVLIPLCEINDAVLLGPAESPELLTARHWRDQLAPHSLAEVMPW